MTYAIGMDIGATRMKAVAVTPAGEVLSHADHPTAAERGAEWAKEVRSRLEALEAEQGTPATAVGVAAPGIADPGGRCITWMAGRMEAVVGLDWTEALARDRLVPVLNDGQAALLGEVWKGAAVGCRNVAMLTLGTGVGGALLCDGRLLRGAVGRAGHLGHLSLDPDGPRDIVQTPGSLEDHIGEASLASRSGGRFTSTRELVSAYAAADPHATELWLASVKALAAAVASVINCVDPERVILAGGITGAGDALLRPLEAFLDRFEWRPHGHRVPVAVAEAGEYAGALGAASHAIEGSG